MIKNKKNLGFTMIEMLGTILVLLVILLIATPSIRRMLNKTNELSEEYIENIIIDAAREYAIVNNKTVTSNLKIAGDTSVITLPTLMNMGLIEQEDIDKLGEDARVLLTLTEHNSIVYSVVYDSSLAQSNAIQLVLIGNNPLHVKQGTPYLEPGYIAYDKNGKIVTDKVVVSGTVNTTTIGNYQLTYRLTDDLGNTEEEIRTVVVVDSTHPVVNTAVVTSNNIHNNKYAKNGEIVTLNITFSKVVTDPKVTIGKREAVVTGSGNTRVATLTIPSDESTLVNKALEIKISEYKDIHENAGEEKENVTSGGLVVFDNIKPIIISSTIISNNANNKLVKNNETITMTSVFSEPIINPIIRIGGRVTTISGTTTNTITSSYLIPSGESTLTQGNIEGTITSYMDRAGNFGESNDIKLVGATVLYDRTPPTCVATKSNTGTTSGVTFTVTGSDSESGIASGTGTFTGIKSTTSYSVTNGVGLSTTCTGTSVTAVTQRRLNSCSNYGNYTVSMIETGTCVEKVNGTSYPNGYDNNFGFSQVWYLKNSNPALVLGGTYREVTICVVKRKCYCTGVCNYPPPTNEGWFSNTEFVYNNNAYNWYLRKKPSTDGCQFFCNYIPVHVTCTASTYQVNEYDGFKQFTYSGTCLEYKSYGTWSTSTCTPTANQTQCESRIIYN